MLFLHSENLETALGTLLEDWEEWNLPWTCHEEPNMKELTLRINTPTLNSHHKKSNEEG